MESEAALMQDAQASRKVYAVSELTREIKFLLENNFRSICVRGEISEYSPNSLSGHVYMSVKDAHSQLRVVFFRAARNCQAMGLKVGSEIEIGGRVTVYEAGGNYQVLAEWVRPVGIGGLRLQFEELQRRLGAEGLFDIQRKRPIPAFPKCVGVVTSSDGAALKDFLNVLGRRHSGMHVRIFPVPVQGKDAAPRIARALEYVNANHLCDVIVLTRGGGSLEDLWPFNEEVLARAIAASEIPLISAVGHERDFTISDYVADFRCATPSVAAEQVVAAKEQLFERLMNLRQRLNGAMRFSMTNLHNRYVRASERGCMLHPEEICGQRHQRLDMLCQRLQTVLPRRMDGARQALEHLNLRLNAILPGRTAAAHQWLNGLVMRLHALPVHLSERKRHEYELCKSRLDNDGAQITTQLRGRLERSVKLLEVLGPRNVLSRGYSILLKKDGCAVRASSEVVPGEELKALLGEGELTLFSRRPNTEE